MRPSIGRFVHRTPSNVFGHVARRSTHPICAESPKCLLRTRPCFRARPTERPSLVAGPERQVGAHAIARLRPVHSTSFQSQSGLRVLSALGAAPINPIASKTAEKARSISFSSPFSRITYRLNERTFGVCHRERDGGIEAGQVARILPPDRRPRPSEALDLGRNLATLRPGRHDVADGMPAHERGHDERGSPTFTATTSDAGWLRANASTSGSSFLHGAHHDAQKSRNTSRPR